MEQSFRISDAGKFVTIEGLRLHYVGEGSGAPVVLLHGNAGFVQDFSRVMPLLAERGYGVIAFDRPGHGQSERPNNGLATAEFQFKLIRKALRRLKVENPILVGHSWSALLVLAYALKYEKEISGMVLLSPAVYPEEEQFGAQRALIEIPGLGDLILKVSGPFIGREIRQNLERAFSPDEVPAEYLELATQTWGRPGQVKAIVQDEANFGPAAEELSRRYSEIGTPTVIVAGDSDLEVNPERHAFPLHKAIEHSRLIILPATGHMIPHTRPEAVLNAVESVRAQSSL